MQISKSVLFPTLGIFLLFSAGIIYMTAKSSRMRAVSGAEGLIGAIGVVKQELNPAGSVMVHGELWNAECEGQIGVGESVAVESMKGLKITVKKVEIDPPH